MKKSLIELKALLTKQIETEEKFLNSAEEQKNNPQIKEMIIKSEARKEALQDVLYYINTGSKIMLTL